jgi:hypothetical protein
VELKEVLQMRGEAVHDGRKLPRSVVHRLRRVEACTYALINHASQYILQLYSDATNSSAFAKTLTEKTSKQLFRSNRLGWCFSQLTRGAQMSLQHGMIEIGETLRADPAAAARISPVIQDELDSLLAAPSIFQSVRMFRPAFRLTTQQSLSEMNLGSQWSKFHSEVASISIFEEGRMLEFINFLTPLDEFRPPKGPRNEDFIAKDMFVRDRLQASWQKFLKYQAEQIRSHLDKQLVKEYLGLVEVNISDGHKKLLADWNSAVLRRLPRHAAIAPAKSMKPPTVTVDQSQSTTMPVVSSTTSKHILHGLRTEDVTRGDSARRAIRSALKLELLDRMLNPLAGYDNLIPATERNEQPHLEAASHENAEPMLLNRQQMDVARLTFPEKGYAHSVQVRWTSMYDFLTACGLQCRAVRGSHYSFTGQGKTIVVARPHSLGESDVLRVHRLSNIRSALQSAFGWDRYSFALRPNR